jgi:hypothetical protein
MTLVQLKRRWSARRFASSLGVKVKVTCALRSRLAVYCNATVRGTLSRQAFSTDCHVSEFPTAITSAAAGPLSTRYQCGCCSIRGKLIAVVRIEIASPRLTRIVCRSLSRGAGCNGLRDGVTLDVLAQSLPFLADTGDDVTRIASSSCCAPTDFANFPWATPGRPAKPALTATGPMVSKRTSSTLVITDRDTRRHPLSSPPSALGSR